MSGLRKGIYLDIVKIHSSTFFQSIPYASVRVLYITNYHIVLLLKVCAFTTEHGYCGYV